MGFRRLCGVSFDSAQPTEPLRGFYTNAWLSRTLSGVERHAPEVRNGLSAFVWS